MLTKVEAVIFDLDGTLVDSMGIWKQIDIEYLAKFNLALPDDLQSSIEGMSFTETATYFKERFQIPDDIDQIKATWNEMTYHKYANEVPLKEGVLAFLELLKSRDIKMGIATSNSRELVEVVIKNLKIDSYFDAIHTSCEVLKGKPSPDIYLLVSEKLGVSPDRCLVFEDVPQGILAGKNAGMKVCAVQDNYSKSYEDEKRQLADYFIDSFEELLEQ
ncbi:HAD family hydrolase [Clostridium sp. Marseille-P299]|uniref:HAD family hydrolase n=1 Tax=Clostridium sp. Marseille-P299 TaxID=1805477 RepID=UPI0008332D78|nr:HAD family phosphatase [Clostridium sp. Marseille-P299]